MKVRIVHTMHQIDQLLKMDEMLKIPGIYQPNRPALSGTRIIVSEYLVLYFYDNCLRPFIKDNWKTDMFRPVRETLTITLSTKD